MHKIRRLYFWLDDFFMEGPWITVLVSLAVIGGFAQLVFSEPFVKDGELEPLATIVAVSGLIIGGTALAVLLTLYVLYAALTPVVWLVNRRLRERAMRNVLAR